ncbi:MAG: hypothetical protein Q4A12_06080 [Eubacteriales bacterium]|nr:hypothetical protein [Eubacteriales bacterium]
MFETNNAKTTDRIYCVVRDVLKNWQGIICIAISAVLITYIIVSSCYTPAYTSRCTMVISAKENSTGAYTNVTETEKLTNTIKAVIDSSILKKLTAEKIGESSFNATINVDVVQNTNLLEVSITSPSPLTSFKLLNASLELYPEVSKDVLGKIVIHIFEEPNFPSSPSNAFIYKESIWYAFMFSILIFAAAVSMYSLYSGTVKSEWEISDTLDAKLLGVLYHESTYRNFRARLHNKKKQLLIGAPAISFAFSETVKKICTNIIHFHKKHGGNTILVTSYQKNEGKSIVSANLATALTQRKKACC